MKDRSVEEKDAARRLINLRDEWLWCRALMGRGNPCVCREHLMTKIKETRKNSTGKTDLKATTVILTGSCPSGRKSVFFYITPGLRTDIKYIHKGRSQGLECERI